MSIEGDKAIHIKPGENLVAAKLNEDLLIDQPTLTAHSITFFLVNPPGDLGD